MLSREHGIAEFEFGTRTLRPDRLTRHAHAHYLRYAEEMVGIYQAGQGRTRQELHRDIHTVFEMEPACPVRRIAAFCKLLDDASTYDGDRRGEAAQLRKQVFTRAGEYHPLVSQADNLFEYTEAEIKQKIATELHTTWDDIDQRLFADIIEFQRLRQFQTPTGSAELLARYNVGQLQVALYDAVDITIRVRDDFKSILRYAKLARLMHTIRRFGGGYEICLDGPASVLRQTRRYGVAIAKFLPALLACRNWDLRARLQVQRGNWCFDFFLSSTDGYRVLDSATKFDSNVEEEFASKWGAEPRQGWTLHREAAILHQGQKAFVPDFVLRHQDGREVLFEIVGYWTPEYLAAKARTLAAFQQHDILLAVAEAHADQMPAMRRPIVTYTKSLPIASVLRALSEHAAHDE